ncbi:phage major tail tube protein [Marinomonas ostreistagni]|uniref:Phage major tail tube protein n=1 Tax=Marinomonas ostreistagni TaxID=359209 RepID=A0ABS0ZBZ9_9GAMM|nr:phage major tail tube protein [Marinomonas ostreistagni]MBJ7550733.1 phage major tail tube protein [Marinomonas ostreistagni]
MAINILKNFNLTVDGRGEVGAIDEYTPPTFEILTEEYRGGGMDSADDIDMGMAPIEVMFKMNGYDLETMALWGVGQGSSIPLTARGWLQDQDGVNTSIIHNMTGRITKMEQEAWKAGERSGVVFTVRPKYFKITHGSTVITEIDIKGSVRNINGTDQLAAMRSALGL